MRYVSGSPKMYRFGGGIHKPSIFSLNYKSSFLTRKVKAWNDMGKEE